jgi:hypothetical protein
VGRPPTGDDRLRLSHTPLVSPLEAEISELGFSR